MRVVEPGTYSLVSTPEVRTGDIVLAANLVPQKKLNECLQVAAELQISIGRILVMWGLLSERQLRLVLDCQRILREKDTQWNVAIAALKQADRRGTELQETLSEMGYKSTPGLCPLLGALLCSSGFISRQEMTKALSQAELTHLPIGRILVLSGVLDEGHLHAALRIQYLIREGRLTQQTGQNMLQKVRTRRKSLDMILLEEGLIRQEELQVELSELLLQAKLITVQQLNQALELSTASGGPLGVALIEQGVLSYKILDATLQCQSMIESCKLDLDRAMKALKFMQDTGCELSKALAQSVQFAKPARITYLRFLTLVECVATKELANVFQDGHEHENDNTLQEFLLARRILDRRSVDAAFECMSLVQEQRLTVEQACSVYELSKKRSQDVTAVLRELGWGKLDDEGAESFQEGSLERRICVCYELLETFVKDRDPRAIELLTEIHEGKIDSVRQTEMLITLANRCTDIGLFSHANKILEKILSTVLTVKKDPDSHEVATIVTAFARLKFFEGDYLAAEGWCECLVRMTERIFGREHSQYIESLHYLAFIYFARGKMDDCHETFQAACLAARKSLGGENPLTLSLEHNYSIFLKRAKRSA